MEISIKQESRINCGLNANFKITLACTFSNKTNKKMHYVADKYTLFSFMFVYLHSIKLTNSLHTLYKGFFSYLIYF